MPLRDLRVDRTTGGIDSGDDKLTVAKMAPEWSHMSHIRAEQNQIPMYRTENAISYSDDFTGAMIDTPVPKGTLLLCFPGELPEIR